LRVLSASRLHLRFDRGGQAVNRDAYADLSATAPGLRMAGLNLAGALHRYRDEIEKAFKELDAGRAALQSEGN
jgi:hypothetical protein